MTHELPADLPLLHNYFTRRYNTFTNFRVLKRSFKNRFHIINANFKFTLGIWLVWDQRKRLKLGYE